MNAYHGYTEDGVAGPGLPPPPPAPPLLVCYQLSTQDLAAPRTRRASENTSPSPREDPGEIHLASRDQLLGEKRRQYISSQFLQKIN